MSSFIDCVRQAVTDGKITSDRADAAEEAYNAKYADGLTAGLSDGAAHSQAAFESMNAITERTKAQQWSKINELKKAKALADVIGTTKNFGETLTHLTHSIEVGRERIHGQALERASALVEASRPKALGVIRPLDHLEGVIDAGYGASSSAEASDMYKGTMDAQEYLRRRANDEGANIPENKNRRLPQQHDGELVAAVSQHEWVSDMIQHGDFDQMEYHGEKMGLADRAEILGRTYNAIITDGKNRVVPGQASGESLTSRLNNQRFLYFKDAAGYKFMMNKYGQGNLLTQFLGNIHAMAHDVALMEKMGPNPPQMQAYVERSISRRAGDLGVADRTKAQALSKKADLAITNWRNQMAVLNGNVLSGKISPAASFFGGTRQLMQIGLLTGSYPGQLVTDLPLMQHAASFYKLPGAGLIRGYASEMRPLGRQALRDSTASFGIVLHDAISSMYGYQRFFGTMEPRYAISRLGDIAFRAGMSSAHFQAIGVAWQKEFMAALARDAGKEFADLPYKELFQNQGITPDDWDRFRQVTPYEYGGGKFLRPIDARVDGGDAATARSADRIQDAIIHTGMVATNHPGVAQLTALGAHTPPGTMVGEFMRTVSALRTFPTTLWGMIGKEVLATADPKTRMLNAARFAAYLMGGGIMYAQVGNLKQGKDLEDMTTLDFAKKATLGSGMMGIIGDVMFNDLNGNGSGLAGALTGPYVEDMDTARNMTIGELDKLSNGQQTDTLKQGLKLGTALAPKPWYLKTAFDRMVSDELLKQIDPGAYQRLQAAQEKSAQAGQTYWWQTGGDPRLPQYGAGQ